MSVLDWFDVYISKYASLWTILSCFGYGAAVDELLWYKVAIFMLVVI